MHRKLFHCSYLTTASVLIAKEKNEKTVYDVQKSCENMIQQHMIIKGEPGLSICVSINGKNVWSRGFGYADVENSIPCTAKTVMRIASISKPITMAVVAKLVEEKKIDLDKSIYDYIDVSDFPRKSVDNKTVDITPRQLLSHTAGIRHYNKPGEEKKEEKKENEEFYSTQSYENVSDALKVFKNDDLLHSPGTSFSYTTYGFTLLSAVVEKVSGKTFLDIVKELWDDLGMENTFADEHEPIIENRGRQYIRNEKGVIVNAPYVNNSNKWAGGGFISNVEDLNRFGNIILYSYQNCENADSPPGFLKSETVKEFWQPFFKRNRNDFVGLGWMVTPKKETCGMAKKKDLLVGHSGGAMGGSSYLLIKPKENQDSDGLPCGIVVTILTNISGVGLRQLATQIADEFNSIQYS